MARGNRKRRRGANNSTGLCPLILPPRPFPRVGFRVRLGRGDPIDDHGGDRIAVLSALRELPTLLAAVLAHPRVVTAPLSCLLRRSDPRPEPPRSEAPGPRGISRFNEERYYWLKRKPATDIKTAAAS
jgi:hypothetical protein